MCALRSQLAVDGVVAARPHTVLPSDQSWHRILHAMNAICYNLCIRSGPVALFWALFVKGAETKIDGYPVGSLVNQLRRGHLAQAKTLPARNGGREPRGRVH